MRLATISRTAYYKFRDLSQFSPWNPSSCSPLHSPLTPLPFTGYMSDIQMSQLRPGTVPEAVTSAVTSDARVDRQYVLKGIRTGDYLKEPWRHCRDPINSYLSLRQHKKSTFLEKLETDADEGPEKKRSLVDEIKRIDEVRNRFETDTQLRKSIDALNTAHEKWRAAVSKALPEVSRKIQGDQQKRDN